MDDSITWAERQSLGCSLVDLGFRDYTAARFLLNNEFVVQGLTLASSAVEKYLKALIVFTSEKKEKYYYHLDKLIKLKNILNKHNRDVTKDFDPVFLSILEKAYKIRYYDQLDGPIKIGLFLNQFIGELDYTIHFLEAATGPGLLYNSAVQHNDPHLYQNNYILNKENKKDFMEKPDTAFEIYIQIGATSQRENKVFSRNVMNKYDGRLAVFNNPFGKG